MAHVVFHVIHAFHTSHAFHAFHAVYVFHVWRLYVKSNDDRELVGLYVDFHFVALWNSDPSINLRKPSERVIIKGIPLPISISVESSSVYVSESEIITKGHNIIYYWWTVFSVEKEKKYTVNSWLHYMDTPVVRPFINLLKSRGVCVEYGIIFRSIYFARDANKLGHDAEDIAECDAYIDPSNIAGFRSRYDVLCNMFACKFQDKNLVIQMMWACLLWTKVWFLGDNEMGQELLTTPDTFCAKRLAATILPHCESKRNP